MLCILRIHLEQGRPRSPVTFVFAAQSQLPPSSKLRQMSSFFKSSSTPRANPAVEGLIAQLAHLQLTKAVTPGTLKGWGGFSDVYDGRMKVKGRKHKKKVAIKRFRVNWDGDEQERLLKVSRFIYVTNWTILIRRPARLLVWRRSFGNS